MTIQFDLADRAELVLPKELPLVVHAEPEPIAKVCGDQTRRAAVASMLLRVGRDARLVMGGMVDWIERGYPVEKEAVTA